MVALPCSPPVILILIHSLRSNYISHWFPMFVYDVCIRSDTLVYEGLTLSRPTFSTSQREISKWWLLVGYTQVMFVCSYHRPHSILSPLHARKFYQSVNMYYVLCTQNMGWISTFLGLVIAGDNQTVIVVGLYVGHVWSFTSYTIFDCIIPA